MLFATIVSAHDIQVVNCETILKIDAPPADKILHDVYVDIEQNPSDFVCAYDACDFQHNTGWFAIKKDKSVVFHWDKRDNTTVNMIVESNDRFYFILSVSKFNRYGIRDNNVAVDTPAKQYFDIFVDVLLASVDVCNE